jgi:predicted nucleotidyltransferase
MAESTVAPLEGLPGNVAIVLSAFLAAARNDLAADLVSAVLFGSAAEGKLGPTSDVNLLLVLRTFAPDKVGPLRDAFLTAEAAIKLRVMFVLEDEVSSAAELFAQKFADILRRHRTVFGKDVLGPLKVARQSEVFRLRQILLNLVLRLREAYVARGQRPEQVAHILADTFGPLRAACATLLELEDQPASDSTAALASVAASFGAQGADAAAQLLSAHEGAPLRSSSGTHTDDALFQVLALTMQIFQRAARLT